MNLLYWIDRLEPSERPYVGEKAWQLAQLHREGCEIGGGFVIDARLFRSFLTQLEDAPFLLADFPASSSYLDIDNSRSLQWVARQARQAIQGSSFPPEWQATIGDAARQLAGEVSVVRASLSLAGAVAPSQSPLLPAQFCQNRPSNLVNAIKNAWAQLLSAQSLFYWKRKGIDLTQIYPALLVQPVKDAIAAGCLRLEGDRGEIEAVKGLGYALFQGETQPERHDWTQNKILQSQIGHQIRAYAIAPDGEFPLQTRLLSPDEQSRPTLSPEQLEKLIAIARQWQCRSSESGTLEWSFIPQPSGEILRIHQWIPHSPVLPFLPQLPKRHPEEKMPVVAGVGASSGKVAAIAHTIARIDDLTPFLPDNCILIAPYIPPSWLPHLKTLKGIVIEQGSATSHVAILARELGIPAIVAAEGAVERLRTGDFVVMDGHLGQVRPQSEAVALTSVSPNLNPVLPQSPIRTQLMVSISQQQSIKAASDMPVDGLGLLRSELMVIELLRERPLSQWLQPDWQETWVGRLADLMQEFLAAFAPKPVFYRTYDRKPTLPAPFVPQAADLSLHPQRGTHGYCLDSLLFDLELQAIQRVRASGRDNLRLILPFVRSIPEVLFCQRRLAEHHLEDLPLWIMAEVPSLLFSLPQYAELGIGGIAIGSNDFAQLLLGRDRESTFGAEGPSTCPLPLIAALQQLVKLARSLDLDCSICGQAPVHYPSLIPLLVDWGITAISVEPPAIVAIRAAIARAEKSHFP